MLPRFKILALLAAASGSLHGADLTVKYLFPAGGQAGSRISVTCAGILESWPIGVWTDDAGLRFIPGQTPGQFEVEISSSVRIGPHLVRFYHPTSVTPPLQFVVGNSPEFIASSSSNALTTPVIDSFPATFNGLITRTNRVNTYTLRLPDNCKLEAAVCAVALDAPTSLSIELLDEKTNRVALQHAAPDHDTTLSSFISAGGVYLLRVFMNGAGDVQSKLLQTEAAVYRVAVSANPAKPPPTTTVEAPRSLQTVVEMFRPMVAVRTLMIPSLTRGVIAPAGRQINYGFETRGQERFRFRVIARSIDSPLQPRLRVLDSEMNVLAEAPPAGDAELIWVSPGAGNYIVAVSDMEENGGPLYSFQLEVASPEPFFRATVESHSYTLKPGGSTPVVVNLKRPAGSTSILQVSALSLPDGISCVPQTAEPAADKVTLQLKADSTAPPANRPFVVSVVDVRSVPPQLGYATAPLVGRYAPLGKLLINETDQLWLTVAP